MPTAAVSQEPVRREPTASSADDVEAVRPTTNGQAEDASAPVEVEAEQEQDDHGRISVMLMFINGRRQMADFPFFALAFAAVVSLVFIISDLMNQHTLHPITAGVFLLSSSYCIAVIRREWGPAGAEGAAGASGQPGILTKEARESLLTYFVYEGSATEGAAESAEGKANFPQPEKEQEQEQEQDQERAEGKELPGNGSTGALVGASSAGGSGGSKSGEQSVGLDCSGSSRNGGGMRDDRGRIGTDDTNADSDTESLPHTTPAASPGPSSPVPLVTLEEQPHLDDDGDGGGSGAAGTTTAAVGPTAGLDQLDDEGRGKGEGEEKARRKQGSAPFDGRGLDLATEATSTAARIALSNEDGKAAPETPETTADPEEQQDSHEAAVAPAAAAATASSSATAAGVTTEKRDSGSDPGEWSTDHSCIVCFGDYCPGDLLCRLPCRHVYHAKCIDEWLDRARLPCCPLCKTDLLASRTDAGNGIRGNNNRTAASGRGDGGGATGAASGAAVVDVELTGENAV
eukprot:g12295.t2